jgi:hypothetical protein
MSGRVSHVPIQKLCGKVERLSRCVQLFDVHLKHVMHARPFLKRDIVAVRTRSLGVSVSVVVQDFVGADLNMQRRQRFRNCQQRGADGSSAVASPI